MAKEERQPIGIRDPARRILASAVHKDFTTIEKYSLETNGEYTAFRGGVRPGDLPTGSSGRYLEDTGLVIQSRLHFHTLFEPTFTTLSGRLGFEIDGVVRYLEVGEEITVPIGVSHRFFNDTEEDCNFTLVARPGNEGYERLLTIMFGLANDGLCGEDGTPNDKTILATILVRGDMWLPGAVGMVVSTLFRTIAAYKSWMGAEKELLEKYWFN